MFLSSHDFHDQRRTQAGELSRVPEVNVIEAGRVELYKRLLTKPNSIYRELYAPSHDRDISLSPVMPRRQALQRL